MEKVLFSERVLFPHGIQAAALWIGADGRISKIQTENLHGISAQKVSGILAAGLVDTHAHINEPGRTEWEGFQTATLAALAGGITTVVDMPLNSLPPTISCEALRLKREAAQGQTWIDYGFWGGVVPQNAANAQELRSMVQAGVLGFKAFMIDSGVPEFGWSNRQTLEAAMRNLAELGVPLLLHAEVEKTVSPSEDSPHAYSHYLHSRPKEWENDAIRLAIELSEKTGCRIHIVHLSSAEAIPLIEDAKRRGVKITVETCPHYLLLHAEMISTGATEFKCAPPIREENNRQGLLMGLRKGTIDMVVSDHSPCTPNLKRGDFQKAWGGIASLQMSMAATWTALSEAGFSFAETHRLMSTQTGQFAGLSKGKIQVGFDADLIEVDPDAEQWITPNEILHRHKVTPYLRQRLRGKVQRTWLRGELKWEAGHFLGAPTGRPALRKEFQ